MTLRATIKVQAADFVVTELLDFPLSGEGEHLWCQVEKSGMNTAFLKREWSRLLGCPQRLISHSGLKDRHALTTQWLCLPADIGQALPDVGADWRIVARMRHRKKLRVGTHRRNAFALTLRHVSGERRAIEARLAALAARGFANAFGKQRFGHDNISRARVWVSRGMLPKKRDERARTLSALRAMMFNRELAERVNAQALYTLLDGDMAMLSGSNSYFEVATVDAALQDRCLCGDIAPAGVLPGAGMSQQDNAAHVLRRTAYTGEQAVLDYLLRYCEVDYRALSVRPQDLHYDWLDDETLALRFVLPRGSFATALLDAVFDEVIDAAGSAIT